MVEHSKIPVVNRSEYTIYLEYFNDIYWLHTDVYKWSGQVKKVYLKELNQLQKLLEYNLYSLIEIENTKLSKFAEVIGFKYLRDLIGNDGNLYKIYTRSL